MGDEGIFDALISAEDEHWAYGTGFEDPLAGLDLAVPEGIDGQDLAAYCLMLGDDALVWGHRLSEWCSNAPDLEDDIALSNVALDLIGQARLLLMRAAAADPDVVPQLPEESPVPPEDRLAFFRDAERFRNVRLAELPNGDFGQTVAQLLLLATWRAAILRRLKESADPVLAAIAAKGLKEARYHQEYAAQWFVTLALGTDESRRRLADGYAVLLPFTEELFRTHPVETRLGDVAVEAADVRDEVSIVLDAVFADGTLDRPDWQTTTGGVGRNGTHTEALSRMLAEMQSVARAHPMGVW